MAPGSEEARKASADARSVVADATSGAVAASLITIAVERVRSRGAFLELARSSAVASVAETAHMLHGIPRSSVDTVSLGSEVFLRPASAAVIAVVRAVSALAGVAVISGEAAAEASGAVAEAFVGALSHRVEVIRVSNSSDPSMIIRASAQRAVRTSPFGVSIEASVALAVDVLDASAMAGALVFAEASLAVAALIPDDFSPACSCVGRST